VNWLEKCKCYFTESDAVISGVFLKEGDIAASFKLEVGGQHTGDGKLNVTLKVVFKDSGRKFYDEFEDLLRREGRVTRSIKGEGHATLSLELGVKKFRSLMKKIEGFLGGYG